MHKQRSLDDSIVPVAEIVAAVEDSLKRSTSPSQLARKERQTTCPCANWQWECHWGDGPWQLWQYQFIARWFRDTMHSIQIHPTVSWERNINLILFQHRGPVCSLNGLVRGSGWIFHFALENLQSISPLVDSLLCELTYTWPLKAGYCPSCLLLLVNPPRMWSTQQTLLLLWQDRPYTRWWHAGLC